MIMTVTLRIIIILFGRSLFSVNRGNWAKFLLFVSIAKLHFMLVLIALRNLVIEVAKFFPKPLELLRYDYNKIR